MAMDIISKDKKEIQWKGLPRTCLNDIEELKVWNSSVFNSCNMLSIVSKQTLEQLQTQRTGLRNKIEKKAAYLQELEEQVMIF